MLHNLKHKNSKKMGKEAVRRQILTIAFLSLFIGVFCFAGSAAAVDVSIADVALAESDAGTTCTFTVTITGGTVSGTATFSYATSDGTATTGDGDYSGTTGTVTFNNTETVGATETFDVPITGDTKVEGNETFTVTLTPQDLADTVTGSPATGTITNDDQFGITVDSPSGVEGSNVTFTVTVDVPRSMDVDVTYTTADGTATTGDSDYTQYTGTVVTIPAGAAGQTATFNVATTADAKVEADETFGVTVSSADTNFNGVAASGTGTITNDDQFGITVDSPSGVEGSNVTFTVTVDVPRSMAVNATYTTADGTATTLDSDYTQHTNTVLPIPAGAAGQTVTFNVATGSDGKVEADETFGVTVSSADTNFNGVAASGTGTITNDDQFGITVDSSSGVEGSDVTFTVTVDEARSMDVDVTYTTADGTATTGDSDYTQYTGTVVTIPAGAAGQTATFNVATTADAKVEADETFGVTVSSADTNFNGVAASGTGTITNDDQFGITVDSPSGVEGSDVTFTVTVDGPRSMDVDVTYTTADGTATTGDSDYTQYTDTVVTIPAGAAGQTATFNVATTADAKVEADETFGVTVSSADTNFNGVAASGTGTITNDDQFGIVVNTLLVPEGATATFTITLGNDIDAAVNVTYDASDGTATVADNDYTDSPGSVTFPAGSLFGSTQTFTVATGNDSVVEPDETFTVLVSSLDANFDGNDATGTGTILNDDTYTISINNIVVAEADGTATFTVLLNQAVIAGDSVSVDYITADGSATTAGNDYALADDNLTIGEGLNSGTIDVTIINNTDIEGNENFFLNLGPVTTGNASIGDSQGECVITDNDCTIISTVTPFLDEESGTISPLGSIVVEGNADYTYTMTPGFESCVKDVTVDGASQGPVTTYTFTNVTSNHTINVSFRSLYRITGEIWPSRARTIEGGNGAWKAYNTSAGFDSGWLDHMQNVTITDCSVELVTVEFQDQAGWETPAPQTITLKDEVFVDNSVDPPVETSLVTVEGTYRPFLTVVSSNGTVTSIPAGIDCGGDCDEIYNANLTVQLTAVADAGYVFSEFVGDVTIATSPTNVIMDEPKTVTAVYVVETPGNVDGDGDGWTIDGGDCNDANAQIYPGAPEQCDATDWDCDGLTNDTNPMDADCEELTLSDVPLESQFQPAPANIVFVLDNSGSMDWTIMTDESEGLFEGKYYVFDNPGDNQYGNSHQLTATQRAKWKSQWNGYNKMYYNLAVEYITWPNGDGTRFPDADMNNPRSNPENVSDTLDMDDTFRTIDGVNIINAHYYTWDDADLDGSVDNGEIYLIVLNGGINCYQLDDLDGDGIVENNELASVALPDGIVPKNQDGSPRTYTEERQNFVNWYSFYRRREGTAKAAVGEVIDSLSGVQVGFYSINSFNIGIRQPVLKVRVTENDDDGNPIYTDNTELLLDLLYAMDSQGGTPLRNSLRDVGRYFDADDNNSGGLGDESPWYTDGRGECQQSFAVVMTDGYYNGGNPGIGHQDSDQTGTTDPEGDELYADLHDQTLADVAMMFYKNDLADDIADRVPTNFADDADWQHMVTYGVSFGVTGNYNPDDYNLDTDPGNNDRDYPIWLDPLDPQADWPEKNRRRIDDLWHASVNGRGIFLSATNPEELVSSLKAIMLNLTARIGSGASLSINGEELYAGTIMFQGQYSTDGWAGDVLAYSVNTVTGEVIKDTPLWKASEKLGEGSDWDDVDWSTGRAIATYNPDPSVEAGIAFRWADLTPAQLAFLDDNPYTGVVDSDGLGQARLEYLRGNNENEELNGGTFRDRESKLGDIVHSSPLFEGYDTNNDGDDDYGMIYVGANDGMFHAFNADTGVEKFAYVPNLVFEKLKGLTLPDPHFRHRYFVDLTPYVKNIGTATLPKKLLVGGLSKGAKGYYCLDVTDASNISESNAASWVKWEYPKQDSTAKEKENMGYSFSRAYIVKSYVPGHEWVVIFGNGYGSTSETSALYVLDADTGDLIRMIDTGAGFGNGLSSPVPVDVNGDYIVDYVYAGDLNGNMWKFHLQDSDPAKWGSAYGDNDANSDGVIDLADGETPRPLFKATGREKTDVNSNIYTDTTTWSQPITTQPIVIRHCDYSKSGALVLFGTGKYLAETDLDSTDYQTIYGIWDFGDEVNEYLGDFMRGAGPSDEDEFSNPLLQSATLLQQWVIYWGPNPYNENQNLRVLTDNEPDWGTYDDTDIPKVHAGWYFDLPLNKERVMRDPVYRDGKLIIISSIPENDPCSAGGSSIIHEMDACTGGRLDSSWADINEDGVIDENDFITIENPDYVVGGTEPEWITVPVTGIEIDAMIFPPVILIPPDSEIERKYFVTAGGGIVMVIEPADQRRMFYWGRIGQP